MFLYDYSIPEAEVIYQKAVIRGAWWFFGFMLLCIFVYFVVRKIVEDRKDARAHKRNLARIKASCEIGQDGFYAVQANQGQTIRHLQGEIAKRDRHIERLEQTMSDLHFEDVAKRIREEENDD